MPPFVCLLWPPWASRGGLPLSYLAWQLTLAAPGDAAPLISPHSPPNEGGGQCIRTLGHIPPSFIRSRAGHCLKVQVGASPAALQLIGHRFWVLWTVEREEGTGRERWARLWQMLPFCFLSWLSHTPFSDWHGHPYHLFWQLPCGGNTTSSPTADGRGHLG